MHLAAIVQVSALQSSGHRRSQANKSEPIIKLVSLREPQFLFDGMNAQFCLPGRGVESGKLSK
jgi:hypothetical protein